MKYSQDILNCGYWLDVGTRKPLQILHGDGCVTGGRPGLQNRVCGTNPVTGGFDSYTSPPHLIINFKILILLHNWTKTTVNVNGGAIDIGPGIRRQKSGNIGEFLCGAKPAHTYAQLISRLCIPVFK